MQKPRRPRGYTKAKDAIRTVRSVARYPDRAAQWCTATTSDGNARRDDGSTDMTIDRSARRHSGARTLFGRLIGHMEANLQRKLLHALSDHTLRDIGLTRGGIDEAVRAAFDTGCT